MPLWLLLRHSGLLYPTIVNLLMLILWPEVLQWSNIGEGGFWCSLNLSAKVLPDSPMYPSPHPCSLHWYLYMTPLLLLMGSFSLGTMRRLLMVCPPLKCTCTPYLLHVFFTLYAEALMIWNHHVQVLIVNTSWAFLVCCSLFLLGFWLFSFALFMAHVLDLSMWWLLYGTRYQPHCIWMVCCGSCPIAGINQCELVF